MVKKTNSSNKVPQKSPQILNTAAPKTSLDKNKQTATCPMHKWTLKLEEGKYENNCPKKPLEVMDYGAHLEIKRFFYEFDDIDTSELIDKKIDLNFNAHASITITIDDIKLTSDPWYMGSCFATGWWHVSPPSEESIERLTSSDFIYISHNHSDHLHIPTLERFVAKDTPIIVPNFESRSVESILTRLGYKNLIIVDFLKELDIRTPKGKFRIVIVKSGDERDDSSLLIVTKGNKVFLGVDTNMPNDWILPGIDILYTAFAGGSSGFPSRIDNFSLERKKEIIRRNRLLFLSTHVRKLVTVTKPKYVVPYAGYFTESYRDNDVKLINQKNTPDEVIDYVENLFPGVKGINPLQNPHVSLHGNKFIVDDKNESPSYFVDEKYIEDDVKLFTVEKCITDEFLINVGIQYLKSGFYDDLSVVFLPSNDDISSPVSKALVVDFSNKNRSYKLIECRDIGNEEIVKSIENSSNNIEILRLRADSFIGVLENGLPLEDLSIGFQAKMFRYPNVYNFDFWNHFTTIEFIKTS